MTIGSASGAMRGVVHLVVILYGFVPGRDAPASSLPQPSVAVATASVGPGAAVASARLLRTGADHQCREPSVSLVPIPSDAFVRWRANTVREFAAGKVAAGSWAPDESVERAEATFSELLPDGPNTPDHHVWSIRGPDDTHIGVPCVGPHIPSMPGALYTWEISIEPEWRGRGYGRATMEALHSWARAGGFERIGLHVFGWNEPARQLFRTAGNTETDVIMEKRALGARVTAGKSVPADLPDDWRRGRDSNPRSRLPHSAV